MAASHVVEAALQVVAGGISTAAPGFCTCMRPSGVHRQGGGTAARHTAGPQTCRPSAVRVHGGGGTSWSVHDVGASPARPQNTCQIVLCRGWAGRAHCAREAGKKRRREDCIFWDAKRPVSYYVYNSQVEAQLAGAMEQLEGLGRDMEKKKAVSRRVKALRADIASQVPRTPTFSRSIPPGKFNSIPTTLAHSV